MKKLLFAAAAATVVTSPAYAAPASDSFVVNGDVVATCVMESVPDIALNTLSIATTADAGALLLNGNEAQTGTKFYVSCNQNNTLTLSGSALKNTARPFVPGVDDPSFTDTINYKVTAVNYQTTGTQPSWSSLAGASGPNSRAPLHRQVQMTASIPSNDNTKRPLAGNYKATVTVTVTAS